MTTFFRLALAALVALLATAAPAAAEVLPNQWSSPTGDARAKGIVITVHGGGWVGVGAQAMATEDSDVRRYTQWGWATLNVDYRPGADSILDVIRFYDLAARRAHGRPVCASGRSAGGHLALLRAAYRPELSCVISMQGPATLLPLAAGRTLPALRDVVVAEFGSRARELSPAYRLGGYRGDIVATYSLNDEIIPGADQIQALRSMSRHVRVVQVVGTPEASAGLASWVHINPTPESLATVLDAERTLLQAQARKRVVRFTARGANAPVDVYTDGHLRHWRKWPVVTVDNIDPGNQCRFRLDARRVLLGNDTLPYFPRRCMTRVERRMRPDPSP